MGDEPFELSVEDVSAGDASGSGETDDAITTGTTRPTAIAVAVIAIVAVAAIVIGTRHDRPAATVRTTLTAATDSPRRSVPLTPIAPPSHASAAALVDDATTCFDIAPNRGGTVSMLIRNQLTRSVAVKRVEFVAQAGVQVLSTTVRTGRSLGLNCLTPADEHTSVGFLARPGPLWIAARLSRTPGCGGAVRSAWRVTYVDRGRVHQVTLTGASFVYICPSRPHLSHGRYG